MGCNCKVKEHNKVLNLHVIKEDEYGLNNTLNMNIKTIIDIGGNTGVFAKYASKLHPNAIIYSVEPITTDILKEEVKDNKNIKVLKKAIGEEGRGYRVIDMPEGLGSSQTRLSNDLDTEHFVSFERFINDLNIDLKTTILKVDCESCEYHILSSVANRKMVKEFAWVAMELHYGDKYQPIVDKDYYWSNVKSIGIKHWKRRNYTIIWWK